jgi:hypothetical protein
MIKPEEMSTSRLRTYAKKNAERVESWRTTVLHKQLVKLLTEAHGDEETPDASFSPSDITDTRGQVKIFGDLMNEYDLACVYTNSQHGYKTYSVNVYEDEFLEQLDAIGEEEPEFNSTGVDKTNECDIYILLKAVTLPHLIYIYRHQDEFCFMNKMSKDTLYSSVRKEGLGVFHKDLKEEADNLSFRNAMDDFYNSRSGDVAKMVFGNDAPMLNPISTDYSDGSIYGYSFVGVHGDCLPKGKAKITEENMELLIKQTTERLEIFQDTLDQLKELQASLLEAGGDAAFDDLYYKKMIEEYYLSLPLFINSKNKEQKELALRASKKKFH